MGLRRFEFSIRVYTTILPVLISVCTLIYLGWTFDNNDEIDKNDWKKKWIIFFAWLGLVSSVLLLIPSFVVKDGKFLMNRNKLALFGGSMIIILLNSIFTLQYLGWTFDDNRDIAKNDWKRKWIIFFAWFTLVLSTCHVTYSKSEVFVDTRKSTAYV